MLPEGRKLFLDISQIINKRYTTQINSENLQALIHDITQRFESLLLIHPPFNLSLQKSHLQFVREYSKLQDKSKITSIYVYDNGNLISGSPFSSYKEVHYALGLNSSSNTCSRYIDTGKLYKSRYLIMSTPKP